MATDPPWSGQAGRTPGPGDPPGPVFHIVLVAPQIPNNTGNIGRTCVAIGAALHLVHPLGFDMSEKARRRAGLDYWPRLIVREHASWDAYLEATGHATRWYFTTRAARPVYAASLGLGDHLVFGNEVAGLPADVLGPVSGRSVCLPMVEGERSLNLATAVCAAAYEGLRQVLARGQAALDERGRLVVPQARNRV